MLRADHLPQAVSLSAALGWPYREEDWRFAFELGHGVVVETDGGLAATALWWPYGETFASFGMIIVAPALQGRGIGRLLMDELLRQAEGRAIVLNSTREGYRLYERLGFVPCGQVNQHQAVLSAASPESPAGATERLAKESPAGTTERLGREPPAGATERPAKESPAGTTERPAKESPAGRESPAGTAAGQATIIAIVPAAARQPKLNPAGSTALRPVLMTVMPRALSTVSAPDSTIKNSSHGNAATRPSPTGTSATTLAPSSTKAGGARPVSQSPVGAASPASA